MALAVLPKGGSRVGGASGAGGSSQPASVRVVNPIGNIPAYVDLTRELGEGRACRVMNLAVVIAMSVVIVFAVLGNWILAYLFNVNVSELEIAGGVLLFIIALRGILVQGAAYQHPKDRVMVAVSPSPFRSWWAPARSR